MVANGAMTSIRRHDLLFLLWLLLLVHHHSPAAATADASWSDLCNAWLAEAPGDQETRLQAAMDACLTDAVCAAVYHQLDMVGGDATLFRALVEHGTVDTAYAWPCDLTLAADARQRLVATHLAVQLLVDARLHCGPGQHPQLEASTIVCIDESGIDSAPHATSVTALVVALVALAVFVAIVSLCLLRAVANLSRQMSMTLKQQKRDGDASQSPTQIIHRRRRPQRV